MLEYNGAGDGNAAVPTERVATIASNSLPKAITIECILLSANRIVMSDRQ